MNDVRFFADVGVCGYSLELAHQLQNEEYEQQRYEEERRAPPAVAQTSQTAVHSTEGAEIAAPHAADPVSGGGNKRPKMKGKGKEKCLMM